MASLPTSSGSARNKESSSTQKRQEDNSHDPKLKGTEEMSTSSPERRRRSEPDWSNLVINFLDQFRVYNFNQLAERGVRDLKCQNITFAVHFFERALRLRICEQSKSGPESVETMLKYTDEWFAKGREIRESSKTSPAELRAMLNNMTQKITNDILQTIPTQDSADKDKILSIIAEADSKTKYEAITDCSAAVDGLRNQTKSMLKSSAVVPDEDDGSVMKNFFHLSDRLDKEFASLTSLYQVDQTAGCSSNPPEKNSS